jgi:hypothetical protein
MGRWVAVYCCILFPRPRPGAKCNMGSCLQKNPRPAMWRVQLEMCVSRWTLIRQIHVARPAPEGAGAAAATHTTPSAAVTGRQWLLLLMRQQPHWHTHTKPSARWSDSQCCEHSSSSSNTQLLSLLSQPQLQSCVLFGQQQQQVLLAQLAPQVPAAVVDGSAILEPATLQQPSGSASPAAGAPSSMQGASSDREWAGSAGAACTATARQQATAFLQQQPASSGVSSSSD